MEPLSAALTFSTIVGLIGQFRSEKSGKSQSDFNEFLIWLSETQHEEIRNQLEANKEAVEAVKPLLQEQQGELLDRLDAIDSILVSIASGFSGFRELGEAIKPSSVISANGISILRQFELAGGSRVLESRTWDGNRLSFLDAQGMMQIEDERFLEDDLRTLVELGLLRHDFNAKGENIYIYTRRGSDLVRRIDS